MAPRSRLLDLETHDVLIFHYGDDDSASVATHAIVFWPVFLAAVALLLHLAVLFPHAAGACAGLYGAYCFLLDRAGRRRSRPSSAGPPAPAPSHASGTRRVMAGLYDRAELVRSK
ncbi:unnamed protein product [Urochloa decumbens]|uniref:Uncharacterized protein n=1 Tax=Urochloa decumbens TaxID=240449 RepID=A0ABC9EIX5_9POAL